MLPILMNLRANYERSLGRGAAIVAGSALLLLPFAVIADPPPALQDSGGTGIDASQDSSLNVRNTQTGVETAYRLRSFLEPGGTYNLSKIRNDDITDLAAEVQRLKNNACYDVTVRSLATCAAVNRAVESCDIVFLTAHGSSDPPYLTWGGRRGAQCTSGPQAINADRIWVGACNGPAIVGALNGSGGASFETLPASRFRSDGYISRRSVARALIAQLQALQATQCEVPQKVCLMAGVQDLETQ